MSELIRKSALLALGGGFNGAFSAGIFKYFWEKKLNKKLSYMQLVSVSSLNGLKLLESDDAIEEMIALWKKIEKRGPSFIFRLLDIPTHLSSDSLFNNNSVKVLIDNLNIDKIFASPIITEIVTKNESQNGELSFFINRFFDNNKNQQKADFKKAALASTALAGIFPRIKIKNEWHSDGLILDPTRAITYGCNRIFIINNDHDNLLLSRNLDKEHWLTRLGKSLTNQLYNWVDERLKLFKILHPECEIIVLKPTKSLPHISTFHFRKDMITRTIDHGYEVADSLISKLQN